MEEIVVSSVIINKDGLGQGQSIWPKQEIAYYPHNFCHIYF